ncbi:MAG: hypothetical protein J7598_10525 [Mitsuaria chitosanitabida]|uniref:hypothetical protein n=1 Tax=Roseateles chitosanitabidus TaxID=65048 RepID=UPI001B2C60AF|nr:hypothetical protein [Roseateles chitosanitabidus]MBO9687039.1 hypothetical protein [Roseateles chitosanitabidus]
MLWDATLIYADKGHWTLTGIERVEVDGGDVAFRQTWALRELPAGALEEIEKDIAGGREPKVPMVLRWATAEVPEPPPHPDPRKTAGASMRSYRWRQPFTSAALVACRPLQAGSGH